MEGFSQFPDIAFFAASTIIIDENKKVIRVPLQEWPREGRFLPEEGLREMIAKYVVPTTVLCRKSAPIDWENPPRWDCDFFIQLAGRYPFAISKKSCGVYVSHSSSFSACQDSSILIRSISRLMARVESFPWMNPGMKKDVIQLLHTEQYHTCCELILRDLSKSHFIKAKSTASFLLKTYPLRWKTLLFFIIATTCHLLPPLIFFFLLLKKIRHSLRRGSCAPQNLESYLPKS